VSGQGPKKRSENLLGYGERWKVQAGMGLALRLQNTGLGGGAPDKAGAEIEVYADGRAEIRTSSAELGQGLPAVLAAVTAERARSPYERVSVLLSDTDRTPNGGPTTASRQTFMSGNAARHASAQMREVLSQVAASGSMRPRSRSSLSTARCAFSARHTRACVSFGEVVQWAQDEGASTRLTYDYEAPRRSRSHGRRHALCIQLCCAGGAGRGGYRDRRGHGAQSSPAHDIGRAINPPDFERADRGGIVMGMGNALTEEYIVENGVPIRNGFALQSAQHPACAGNRLFHRRRSGRRRAVWR